LHPQKYTSKNTKPLIEKFVSASKSWNLDLYSYPKGQAQMTLLKINTPIGYKAAVYHSQLGIAHIVKGKLIVGATANKKKDFSVGDSFAKTVANTPD